MIHFICRFTDRWIKSSGHTEYRLRIYRIVKNELKLLADETDTSTGDNQMFMELAEKHKLLPKRCFARSEYGNKLWSVATLREKGIATVHFIN